jgi:hypothetical protein
MHTTGFGITRVNSTRIIVITVRRRHHAASSFRIAPAINTLVGGITRFGLMGTDAARSGVTVVDSTFVLVVAVQRNLTACASLRITNPLITQLMLTDDLFMNYLTCLLVTGIRRTDVLIVDFFRSVRTRTILSIADIHRTGILVITRSDGIDTSDEGIARIVRTHTPVIAVNIQVFAPGRAATPVNSAQIMVIAVTFATNTLTQNAHVIRRTFVSVIAGTFVGLAETTGDRVTQIVGTLICVGTRSCRLTWNAITVAASIIYGADVVVTAWLVVWLVFTAG